MAIEINEFRNEVLTDIEISNRVAAMIESAYPSGRELKIMRIYLANPQDAVAKAAFDAYNVDVELMRAEGVTARKAAALVRAAISVEAAQLRLMQPQLSIGAPERTITVVTGQVMDEATMMLVDVTRVEVIQAIEPVPSTVLFTDENGAVTKVQNPAIATDDAERVSAQGVIDTASADVMILVARRAV